MKNLLTPAGIEPATSRFVAQHLNHCATRNDLYSFNYTKTHRDIQFKIGHPELFRMDFLHICNCS